MAQLEDMRLPVAARETLVDDPNFLRQLVEAALNRFLGAKIAEHLLAAATAAEEVLRAYIEDSMKDPLLSHLEDIWHLEIEEVEIRRRRPRVRTTFDRTIHGAPFRMMDRIIPDAYPFTYTYHNTWEVRPARFERATSASGGLLPASTCTDLRGSIPVCAGPMRVCDGSVCYPMCYPGDALTRCLSALPVTGSLDEETCSQHRCDL